MYWQRSGETSGIRTQAAQGDIIVPQFTKHSGPVV